jgi:outer membrane biosynthesis protein TonB
VHLVKPPPPPKIKEKPPEPKIEEKKEIIEPEPEKPPEETPDESQDQGPQDDQLGLDSDGTAGSDGFGLKAKKGGSPLIGGGGDSTLMRRYGWYVQLIQDEIRKEVKRQLEEDGGIPEGKLQTLVRIVLERDGELVGFRIVGSSGNTRMDNAVQAALKGIRRFREPLPGDMPRAAMKLKIASKG